MNKEQCVDRDGKSHFGEYGWSDGYHGTIGNCRCSLNSRAGACSHVDECIEESHKKIAGTKNNIVSYNIGNMKAGEKKREDEYKEDKELEAKRRKEEKEKLEESKKKEEAAKEGKIICGACKETVDMKEQPEVSQGIAKCPKCGKQINIQTGELIVGVKEEEAKKEEKKEEETKQTSKEEEPKKEEEKEDVAPKDKKDVADKSEDKSEAPKEDEKK